MTLISVGTWYLYAGGLVALWFIPFGIGRMDENAQGAWVFRPILIPGVLLIWPLVLWRCLVVWRGEQKLDRHRMPRKIQEWASLAFVVAIFLVIFLALNARQDPLNLPQPVLLEAAK